MTELEQTAPAPVAPAIPAAPATPDLSAQAADLGMSLADLQAEITTISAETFMQGIPADQQQSVALGVIQSRVIANMGDMGTAHTVLFLTKTAPTTITKKDGNQFTISTAIGIGYSRKEDGTDGPTGIVEAAFFIRDDTPTTAKNAWATIQTGKTYNINLKVEGGDPVPGTRPIYKSIVPGNLDPVEVPTPPGIDAAGFIAGHYKQVAVQDIANHPTLDYDDRDTWVAAECLVVSARRGISKKGKPYGFYEVVPVGTTPRDIQNNANLKVSIGANMENVLYTVGSRMLFMGPVSPPSEDGQYPAKMNMKQQVPIVGIPYVVTAVAAAPSAAATPENSANVEDF